MPYFYGTKNERFRSFRTVIKEGTADCVEGAITAAAIMSAHGHPPLVVDLRAKNDWDHVIFIYRENGKYGSIALSRDPNLYGRKPRFSTVGDLVMSYYYPYLSDGGWIDSFAVANLDKSKIDWRFSRKDIFELEDFLDNARHRRVKKDIEPAVVRKILQAYYIVKRWIKRRLLRKIYHSSSFKSGIFEKCFLFPVTRI